MLSLCVTDPTVWKNARESRICQSHASCQSCYIAGAAWLCSRQIVRDEPGNTPEHCLEIHRGKGSNRLHLYRFYGRVSECESHALDSQAEIFYHISDLALNWFASYLKNRTQRVVVNGKCSEWCRVTSGTPEGGVISALLFALYVNDLPRGISSRVLLYADDAKVYRKVTCRNDAQLLQQDLQKLVQWSKTWKLDLNASKCKSFTMTLKTKPLTTNYIIGATTLEHVDKIRDLGVILDTKLTFGAHVDQAVRKANCALGVLIRSFQKANPRGYLCVSSVLTSYNAHVRSNLEYCSVIWNGAADTHTERIRRIEHKFLMWLNAHCRNTSASLSYGDLLKHFKLTSVYARRAQQDIMFIRNIFKGRILSSFLLQSFSLSVPGRATRQQPSMLIAVPFARVNTVKEGLFVRLPRQLNRFLESLPAVDMFTYSHYCFRSEVKLYAASL